MIVQRGAVCAVAHMPPGRGSDPVGQSSCLKWASAPTSIRVTDDGGAAEYAVTGSEGVIGIATFLGGESTLSQAVVLSTVCSYRLPADLLKTEFERAGPLSHMLLRYTHALIAQTAQIAGVQSAPYAGKAPRPLDLVMPGPVAFERADGNAETDLRIAGSTPRRCDGGAGIAANGGIDPLRPRPRCGPRSLPAGGAGVRVLRDRQERTRPPAPTEKRERQCCCARHAPTPSAGSRRPRRRELT